MQLPLFTPSSVAQRWTKAYMQEIYAKKTSESQQSAEDAFEVYYRLIMHAS